MAYGLPILINRSSASLSSAAGIALGAALFGACAPNRAALPETRSASAAWPGWQPLSAEQVSEERACFGGSALDWRLVTDAAGHVVPSAGPTPVAGWPPSFKPPESLRAELARAERSRVVETKTGFFVLADAGEFGAKLFWVERSGERVAAIASPRGPSWIGKLSFGVLAIDGLCHGDACAARSRAFRLEAVGGAWTLAPHAEWAGCSGSLGFEATRDAALVASCGALYRVTADGVATVARWALDLTPPVRGEGLVARDRSGAYVVSFGERVARFQPGQDVEWFAAPDCPRLRAMPGGSCACEPSLVEQ